MEIQVSNTQCATPYIRVDETTGEMLSLPCSRCPPCLTRRAAGWAFRIAQEEKHSDSALFVTLTYDNMYVPITSQGSLTLDKTDLQKFFKRLRWEQSKNTRRHTLPIKYFAVGEYGSETFRPHYHTIIFNSTHEKIIKAWSLDNKPLGNPHFGNVTGASIAYTLKYMLKSGQKFNKSDLRKPEFQIMSKKLGMAYLNQKQQLWHKNDLTNRMYLTDDQNKKLAMPRYYKEKLYSEAERELISMHLEQEMSEKASQMTYDQIVKAQQTKEQRQERVQNLHNLMNKNTRKNDKL